MTKTLKALVATAATALLVAGCATGDDTEAPETSTSTSTSTSTTTPPTTSETPEPTPEPEPVPEPAPEPAPAPVAVAPVAPAPVYTPPTFSYCYLADGTAMMSDGTTTYMDSCNESAGGPLVFEDGTSIYDDMPLEVWEGTEWEGTGPPPGYYN